MIQRDFMTSSSYMVFSSVWTLIGAESWSVCTDIPTGISSFSFEQRQSLKLGGRVKSHLTRLSMYSISFKVFYFFVWLMNYVWLLCLKWDYWKLHVFFSMVFPFSGLSRSSLQKNTPHQHNAKNFRMKQKRIRNCFISKMPILQIHVRFFRPEGPDR